jgi:hypothetical protein
MRKQATLKELCYEYSEDDLDLEPTEWHAADCLVKIFDVYAIGFAEWCKQEYDVENTPFHNKWLNVDGEYVSTKELLETYKKEKGL